ncbi:MAG: DUF4136 domain-containing protein [Planctomycetota bacterium]
MVGQKTSRRLLKGSLLLLALSAGCKAPIETRVNRHPGRSMEGRSRYTWILNTPSGDPKESEKNVTPIVHEMVNADFKKRGYTLAADGADFRVRYLVVLYQETSKSRGLTTFSGRGGDDNWEEWYEPLEKTGDRSFDQASLILECVEADSKKFIWRGTAWAAVNMKAKQRDRDRQVREAIAKLLAEFP